MSCRLSRADILLRLERARSRLLRVNFPCRGEVPISIPQSYIEAVDQAIALAQLTCICTNSTLGQGHELITNGSDQQERRPSVRQSARHGSSVLLVGQKWYYYPWYRSRGVG